MFPLHWQTKPAEPNEPTPRCTMVSIVSFVDSAKLRWKVKALFSSIIWFVFAFSATQTMDTALFYRNRWIKLDSNENFSFLFEFVVWRKSTEVAWWSRKKLNISLKAFRTDQASLKTTKNKLRFRFRGNEMKLVFLSNEKGKKKFKMQFRSEFICVGLEPLHLSMQIL